jgi:hypothetical protein
MFSDVQEYLRSQKKWLFLIKFPLDDF